MRGQSVYLFAGIQFRPVAVVGELMNQALHLLHTRSSTPRLQAPAPDAEQLDAMLRAAVRSPDHAQLMPWRLLVVAGEGLTALGELYVKALEDSGSITEEQREKASNMPLRAPMVLVLIARLQTHPKVPLQEQWMTVGCAGHAILLAAQAQGLGAFWRSGEMAQHPLVQQGLGLADNEQVAGFIYLGTPVQERRLSTRNADGLLNHWP